MAQLDPEFTTEGFWVNVAVQALAAIVGTIGAFAVAWLIYQRTGKEDRERFEKTLAHERKLAQDNIAYDRETHRAEDSQGHQERDEEASRPQRSVLAALRAELNLYFDAYGWVTQPPSVIFPLRRDALDQSMALLSTLPSEVANAILLASIQINRYNAIAASKERSARVSIDPREWMFSATKAINQNLVSFPKNSQLLSDESGPEVGGA